MSQFSTMQCMHFNLRLLLGTDAHAVKPHNTDFAFPIFLSFLSGLAIHLRCSARLSCVTSGYSSWTVDCFDWLLNDRAYIVKLDISRIMVLSTSAFITPRLCVFRQASDATCAGSTSTSHSQD